MKRILIALTTLTIASQAAVLPIKYCSKPSGTWTAINVTNNCGSKLENIYAFLTNLSGGRVDQGTIPSSCKTLYIPMKYNAAIYAATPGGNPGIGTGKTRFELTYVNNIASWDISANMGFDYGMSVTAPVNTKGPISLVAINRYSPALYPDPSKTDNQCTARQPCYSNAWNNNKANGKTFNLYICNRPTDKTNTPGVCGCNTCYGYVCPKGSGKFCTTSGSGLYCLQPSSPQSPNRCNKNVKIKCNWGGDAKGGAGCPKSCPVTQKYNYG